MFPSPIALTDAEVQKLHDELVAKLGRELPVELR